jgi:adenine deaminase
MQRRGFLRAGLLGPLSGLLPAFLQNALGGTSGSQAPAAKEVAPPPIPAEARLRQKARVELMQVALGRRPADLIIQNGTLLNTATLELLPQMSLAISGGRIAAVGDVRRCMGPGTRVIDAAGMHLVPGFIDAHYHCESSRLSATQHARVTLPMGLTAYFEGTHEITNAASGLPGVQYFIDEGRVLPQKIYPCVSSATPPSPMETTSGYIGYQEALRSFQQWPDAVRGIDEVMDLPRILDGSERLHGVIQAAIDASRIVEGHGSPPLEVLDGWIAAGISSSHSPRVAEALTMLRKGVYLQLKADRTTEIIKQFLELPLKDWRCVGLAVDDRPVDELLELGSIDYEVRRMIELGVPAPVAYQMGTLNNALHWRVDRDHGILAPGRYADVLLISDLRQVKIEKVFANGELVAEQGRLVKEIAIPSIPEYARNRVVLKRPLRASDFEIAAPPNRTEVTATVLKPRYFSRDLAPITQKLRVKDGRVERDLSRGITKFAIIERYRRTGNIGVSFWEMGFNQGAIAWTVNHDHHNLGVIGATDEDMAFAANRVAELQGGFVVAKDGKVLAELALPVAGLMTHEDPHGVARKITALNRVANEFHPVASLAGRTTDLLTFINLTCDPWKYSLTDLGLYNLETQERMPAVY